TVDFEDSLSFLVVTIRELLQCKIAMKE
nr:hypothetical protein [Tanacetum cinerariifolium]